MKNLVRFDWAMKRLLRNKANFKVLEGFLSELLREDVIILNISDSESNQDSFDDKFNRVDILVENTNKELFIIELQNTSEVDYLMRMLYGVSRVITNYMHLGDDYGKVRKVYSVNIVYFHIGQGSDYVYHGQNEFRGIHENDILQLSATQKDYFGKDSISRLFPEYYIIKVNDFNDVAKDTLDEWIYYLKNDTIRDEFKAKGLSEARKALQLDTLSESERKAYIHHVEQAQFERNALMTSKLEGRHEGIEEGIEKGIEIGIEKVVINCFQNGYSVEDMQIIAGIPKEQIEKIIDKLKSKI